MTIQTVKLSKLSLSPLNVRTVKPIHSKAMPVILPQGDYDGWLGGDDAKQFAVPFPSEPMGIA